MRASAKNYSGTHKSLRLLLPLLVFLLSGCFSSSVFASGAISQSYQTKVTGIAQGALVSYESSKSSLVVPSNSGNAATLVGVASSQPLVELSNSGKNSIQVTVNGTTDALVSDANGPVNVGDKITASPVGGIGMKAFGSVEIVGTAQASLDTVKTVTKTFAGTNGQNVSVKVGLLPITVNATYYSAASSSGSISSFVPPFLQSVANSIAGKSISPLRVLISTLALLLGFIAVIVMLYIAIHSGMISIGRNPLAEDALRRGLVDVIVAAIGVLVITVVVVYAVLFS